MEIHFTLTDIEFENLFESCSLNPEIFTHEAHLRLAWIHIKKYGPDVAIANIRCQLQNFTQHLGIKNKYNETLTVASIKAVYHFMLNSNTHSFREFISENPGLKTNFKQLLLSHYQSDIFNLPIAKEKFLSPELLPFD